MNSDTPGDDQPPVDAAMGDAYQPPDGYTKLVGGAWSMTANQRDTYVCVRYTVPAETYITNIQAQAPAGTHHTVLSIADSRVDGPDGQYACNVSELGMVMLYASGVGTSPLDFPSGVSVKIAAGTQVHLNLHLFNASDNAISGESGIWIKSQPTATPTLAEMVFAGSLNFAIPPSSQNALVKGGCTANRNFSLFAVWPHMHQIAKHSKFEVVRGASAPNVLHDATFSFAEQTYYLKNPVFEVQTGDKIQVTCTYDNPTAQTVRFGDSSTEEMCFVGMYRYPAAGGNIFECSGLSF